MNKLPHGFTLTEVAIVLVIMSLLAISVLTPLSGRIEQQRIGFTNQRLAEIKEALLGFTTSHGHLPCPALAADGISANYVDANEWTCKTYDSSDGYLPWATLGVEGYDGWGRPFRYRADGWFSNGDGIFYPSQLSGSNPKPVGTSKGGYSIQIQDRNGNSLNSNNGVYGSNVVAVVFSCGKNGKPDDGKDSYPGNVNGTVPTATCENGTANKNIYVQEGYVPEQFDDILIWIPKHLLINRLTVAGRWPPPQPITASAGATD